jgi:hypothetical protein
MLDAKVFPQRHLRTRTYYLLLPHLNTFRGICFVLNFFFSASAYLAQDTFSTHGKHLMSLNVSLTKNSVTLVTITKQYQSLPTSVSGVPVPTPLTWSYTFPEERYWMYSTWHRTSLNNLKLPPKSHAPIFICQWFIAAINRHTLLLPKGIRFYDRKQCY